MTSEGQAKVTLILELKDRLKTSFQKAKETVNGNVRDMKTRISSLKHSHVEAFKAMRDEIPVFGRAMALLGNPYVLLTAGLLALGSAAMAATKFANQWQQDMAKVNVTAQLTPKHLKALSNELVGIGKRNVAPLEEIPAAFNKIISAGLDVNTSLKVLEPTLRAAKAGFTDVETVATAGVGVMASSGEDINRVYDVLFATLNKGNAEFKDIAQYLPKIIPLARGAGYSLSETAGAWAYLTAQGQTAEQATTGIMNAMKALSNPTIVNSMKSMGVNVFDSNGKMRPLVDTIGDIRNSLSGLSDAQKMVKLDEMGIRDMEAKSTIMSMILDMEKLKDITDYTANSAGALDQAYEDSKTGMEDWKVLINQIKAAILPVGVLLLGLFGKLGTIARTVFEQVSEKISTVVNWFKELYNKSALVRDIISGLGKGIGWAFKIALIPLKQFWNIVKFIWSQLQDLGAWFAESKLAQGIEKFYLKIRPYFIWLKDIVGQVSEIMYKFITLDFKGGWKAVKDFRMPNIDDIRKEQVEQILERKAAQRVAEENPFAAENTSTANDAHSDNSKSLPATADNSINNITENAKAARNISVNIDSFVKGLTVQNANTENMGEKQIEAIIREHFMRVMANLQTAY